MDIQNDFRFYMPFDVQKSSDVSKAGKMIIGGYASTADEDRQNDIIIQRGLDFSEFLDYGYINYNHDNSIICGYPLKDECKIDSKGFYIKAELLKGVQQAEDMYKASLALQRTNAPRRLGFSVEGKILERDIRGRVTRCKISNVAITNNPVNVNCTWEALAKSMTAGLAYYDVIEGGNGDTVVDINNEKNTDNTPNKEVVEDITTKALTTETTSKEVVASAKDPVVDTNPLIKESLEEKLVDEGYGNSNYKCFRSLDWFTELSDILMKNKITELAAAIQDGMTNLTDEQMTLYLQLTRGISREQAQGIVNVLHLSVGGKTTIN